jgi:adenylate cyclase
MAGWWQRTRSHFAEVRRRRVLRALGLYVVASWVAMQVADVTFEPLGVPAWAQKALIITLALGLVPAAILAWVYDLTRHGLRRTEAVSEPAAAAPTASASVTATATAASGATSAGTGEASPPAAAFSPIAAVAVLPFIDMSQAQDHGWFCDGLAEEIIESLCCVKGLRVASRTASFRFRDGATDPREIGKLLGVDAILEGSLRVAAGRMRVGAKLVDAREGYQTWAETYERATSDVFAVQRQIAEAVARSMKLSLAAPPPGRGEKYQPRSLEAYEACVRGRQRVNAFSRRAVMEAPTHFRRAIALDPDYAQAHAGLADALAQQAQWRFASVEQVLPEGTAAASRALDLAPDLAEAHMAQGHLRSLAGDADGARRAFERALELNPALFDAWNNYARHCYARGEHARAAELFERAHRVRPTDFAPLVFVASALHAAGDEAGARAMARRAAEGLLRQCELEPDNVRAHYLTPSVLHQAGRVDEARALAQRALALGGDEWSTLYNLACYHAYAGETEQALDLLERATASGGGDPEWLRHDPDLASLHGLPRFEAMLAGIHVPNHVPAQSSSPSSRSPQAPETPRSPFLQGEG